MADVVKNYTNGEITVVWQPDKCIHSANCFRNLPAVFNPRVNPWIQPKNANSEETIAVVLGCPSGALTMASSQDSSTE